MFFQLKKIPRIVYKFFVDNKLFVLAVFILLCFAYQYWQFRNNLNFISENSQEVQMQTNQSIAEIRQEYTQQMEAQQEINQRQTEDLARLTADYTQRMETLEKRTRTRRTTFVQETNGNPQEMATRLNRRLGWRSE